MAIDVYNRWAAVLAVAALAVLVLAVVSFIAMIVRWKTPKRRRHVIGLLVALAAVPCLVGIQQLLFWQMLLPSLAREQRAEYNELRRARTAASSLVGVGDACPPFELVDADGRAFSLEAERGKVVLINFFATWCGPCLRELPHVENIWKERGGDDRFALLVIGREETDASVREFRQERKFTFPIAADPQRAVYSLFAKELIPRTIVVSPQGQIIYFTSGYDESDLEELEAVLSKELAPLP